MNWDLKRYYDDFIPDEPSFYVAKQTLTELIMHSDDNGVTKVGNSSIAKSILSSNRTVSRHITILTELGIIETLVKGGQTSALRRINIIQNKYDNSTTTVRQGSDKEVTTVRQGSDKEVTSIGQGSDKEVTTVRQGSDTQMSNEGKLKEKGREEESLDAPLRSATPHTVFERYNITFDLTTKKDTKSHRPRFVIAELMETAPHDITEETAMFIKHFIEYRDSMSIVKDKFKLATARPVERFINQIYSTDDPYDAFEVMQAGEWATYNKKYDPRYK